MINNNYHNNKKTIWPKLKKTIIQIYYALISKNKFKLKS